MASGSPIHLSFQVPSLSPRGTGPAYLVSRLISAYIGYMLVMGVLVLLVPKFESAFDDFKLKLPIVTVALIGMSRACCELYLWGILLPVPAIWAVANFNIPDKHRRRRFRLWAFIAVAAFLIFTLLALFFPLLGLVNATAS